MFDITDLGDAIRTNAPSEGIEKVTGGRSIDDDRTQWDLQAQDLIAPFVAWMATQELSEQVRRNHREAVEEFLYWSRTDHGPIDGRRGRYESHMALHSRERFADSRAALECYAGYCSLRKLTSVD